MGVVIFDLLDWCGSLFTNWAEFRVLVNQGAVADLLWDRLQSCQALRTEFSPCEVGLPLGRKSRSVAANVCASDCEHVDSVALDQ